MGQLQSAQKQHGPRMKIFRPNLHHPLGTTSLVVEGCVLSVCVNCICDLRGKRRRRMMRTRLLWFSLGFASTGAVFTHFIWKDLWVGRHALVSDIDHHFHDLQARVSNLESSSLPNRHKPVSGQVEGSG